MNYQTNNSDYMPDSSLYQATSPDENKFLDDVIVDRVKAIKETIERIEDQIKKRESIRESNIYKIMLGSCEIGTGLLNLPEGWTSDPDIEKKRTALEQQLVRLEKEKRDEDGGLWKDIQSLHKELAEAKREYQDTSNQVRSLMPGGMPKTDTKSQELDKDTSERTQ